MAQKKHWYDFIYKDICVGEAGPVKKVRIPVMAMIIIILMAVPSLIILKCNNVF